MRVQGSGDGSGSDRGDAFAHRADHVHPRAALRVELRIARAKSLAVAMRSPPRRATDCCSLERGRPRNAASRATASCSSPRSVAVAAAAWASSRSGRCMSSVSSVSARRSRAASARDVRRSRSPGSADGSRLARRRLLEQPLRRRRVGDQVDALHVRDRLDDRLLALARQPRQHVVREADVARIVLGVPRQLLGQRVLGIEVQVAEQALAGAELDLPDHAQPIAVVARRQRAVLGMIHVDLGAFVQPDRRRRAPRADSAAR